MPFFDIPAQATEASAKEPNKAALALINAVDQRSDAWTCGSSFRIEAELTLLVMPIRNAYLED